MKNKKWFCMLMCVVSLGLSAGCGSSGGDGRLANKPTSVDDVLQAGIDQENGQKADNKFDDKAAGAGATGKDSLDDGTGQEGSNGASEKSGNTVPADIDVDLTKLSSTMVYSEVFNMMSKPEDYIGKTIKMDGQFTVYHDDSSGNNYFACIIQDATACCAQGMEFVLTEDYSYPADYPQEGDEVAVVGVFDTYMEGDYKYCTLRDSVLLD